MSWARRSRRPEDWPPGPRARPGCGRCSPTSSRRGAARARPRALGLRRARHRRRRARGRRAARRRARRRRLARRPATPSASARGCSSPRSSARSSRSAGTGTLLAGALGDNLALEVPRRPRRRRARPRSPSRARSRRSTACAPAPSRSPPSCSTTSPTSGADRRRPPAGGRRGGRARSAAARPTRPRSPSTRTPSSPCSTPRPRGEVARPHDDPDPARRVARRILQRLNGMGKWGGYHTEFAHLARGFAGNDRKLAEAVGEALLEAGLLAEKPSVGQRHVFLNPRRAADIHALIERGDVPADLNLPRRTRFPARDRLGPDPAEALHRAHPRRRRHRHADAPRPDPRGRPRARTRWARRPAAGYTVSAIRHPDATALVDDLGTLTFAEVHRAHERAGERAARRAGSARATSVAIMCRNHRGFIDTTVALSKLGAHALYLNTAFAGPQITEVAEREQPTAIVYDEEFENLVHERRQGPQALHRLARRRRAGRGTRASRTSSADGDTLRRRAARPTRAASSILTSGTTGTPEGRPAQPARVARPGRRRCST